MNWASELCRVYENNYGRVDVGPGLLPICHSTANAQIEVIISEDGNFISAEEIKEKENSPTIIPVTEDSAAKTSGSTPHPFSEKLRYTAGDYSEFAVGKRSENQKYYRAYMTQLENWAESEETHPAVRALFSYLDKGTLMHDLIDAGVLVLDEETGRLDQKKKILTIPQEEAFVRFQVCYKDVEHTERKTWEDTSLYESYIPHQMKQMQQIQLCYATGEMTACTYKHPNGIRYPGDKAKMFSANDKTDFSYLGRFLSKEEAFSIGYEFSQKLHNAWKWLNRKQGIRIDTMVIIAWTSDMQPVPDPLSCPMSFADTDSDWDLIDASAESTITDPMPALKRYLQKKIWGSERDGKKVELPDTKIMILASDAATTGRLSIIYDELATSDFLHRLETWHYKISWYRFNGIRKKDEISSFSLYEIIDCAFGTEQGDLIKCSPETRKRELLRLLPCVTQGYPIPSDIVSHLLRNASKPTSYKKDHNWRKVIEVACGVIRKKIIEEKERTMEGADYEVALDKECRERDYLYGRLLAVAQVLEYSTYDPSEKKRSTNAERSFDSFSIRPYQTWIKIYQKLNHYLRKMNYPQRRYYMNLIKEITDLFQPGDFENNDRLKPLYLLGYHSQLKNMPKKKKAEDKNTEASEQ